jgi:hypothetical protein
VNEACEDADTIVSGHSSFPLSFSPHLEAMFARDPIMRHLLTNVF